MQTNVKKINEIINSCGKCSVTIDSTKKDYLFNGKDPFSYRNDFFKDLVYEFNRLVFKQVVEKKFDEKIALNLSKKIEDNIDHNKHETEHRYVRFVFDSNKQNNSNLEPKKVSSEAEKTNDRIFEILRVQKNALNKMKSIVDYLAINYGYILDEDIKTLKESVGNDIESIELTSIGKMHVNLGKKDTITLLTLLEQLDIVSFSNTNRNKFIEANFTCKPKSGGGVSDLVKINSNMSNLHEIKNNRLRNTNSFNKLVELLQTKLDKADYTSFAEWLKNSV